MRTYSHPTLQSLKTHFAPAAAATSLCTVALLGLAATPAQAQSPVSPPEHDIFVIGPADGGACSFPVQWDVTSRGLGIDRPMSFLSMSPDWHLTLTNLDTGKTWMPHGDGTISFQDQPDGSIKQVAHGVNYTPFFDQQLIGTWTRYYYPDTNTFSAWVGSGTVVNICDVLS